MTFSRKRKLVPDEVEDSAPKGVAGPLPEKRQKPGRVHGARLHRPPPILTWLQPKHTQEGGFSEAQQPEVDLQQHVEHSVRMVATVWGKGEGGVATHDQGASSDGRVGGMGGPHVQRREGAVSGSNGGLAEDQDSKSMVLQGCSSSDEGGASQEALSMSTAGSASTDKRSSPPSPADDPAGKEQYAMPLSPDTVYNNQLALVKQAMAKEIRGQVQGCNPRNLEEYIATRLEVLRRSLHSDEDQKPPLPIVKQEVQEAKEEGRTSDGPPGCGNHSAELLRRIVTEVRKVVLGMASLKGSILEQIAEAAYSNKGMAVSPCELCGHATSADMAQVLSIGLGHTAEGSELRIGHAAVALLNARLHPATEQVLSRDGRSGLSLLPPGETSDCVWDPSSVARSSTATPLSTLGNPSPGLIPPYSPSPPPELPEHHRLVPPLPSAEVALRGAGGLAVPSRWPEHTLSIDVVGMEDSSIDCDSKPEAFHGLGAWRAQTLGARTSDPLSFSDYAHSALPSNMVLPDAGLTAYPVPTAGVMAVLLLSSKARAGEAALATEKSPPQTPGQRGGVMFEAGTPIKDGTKLEDLFVGEVPVMERQLSVDEMTVRGYLEEEQPELCAGGTAFSPVGLDAVELDLVEDPMGAPHDWESFLRGDLGTPSPRKDWSAVPQFGGISTACLGYTETASSQSVDKPRLFGDQPLSGSKGGQEWAPFPGQEGRCLAAREGARTGSIGQNLSALGAQSGLVTLGQETSRISRLTAAEGRTDRKEQEVWLAGDHPFFRGQQIQKLRSLTELYEGGEQSPCGRSGAEDGKKKGKRPARSEAKKQKGEAERLRASGRETRDTGVEESEVIDLRSG